MTKKEFQEIRKIHKKIWDQLAESGERFKPEEAYVFAFKCPSCEVAYSVVGCLEKITNKTYDQLNRCLFCPVFIWRKNPIGDFAVCESHPDSKISIYHKWGLSQKEDRKKLAKKIANLKWEWISEYEYANIENILKEYKSKFD